MLSGIMLLLAGTILYVFIPFLFILSIFFLVAGVALLAPLVSLRVKLSLGITLLLVSLSLWVFGGYNYLYVSTLFVFAGLLLLITFATRKGRLFLGATLLLSGIFVLVFMRWLEIVGIPVVIAGLVLLATVPKGTTDLKKPTAVTLVGVFTLIGSIGLGLLASVVVMFEAIGSSPWGPGMALNTWLVLLSLGIFSLSGLFLSIVILQGVSSKYLWFALMAYWISIIAFSFIRDLNDPYKGLSFFLGVPRFVIWNLPTYICPSVCIVYFLTKKIRQYFHLIA